MSSDGAPPEYGRLLERGAELADLRGIGALLWWDQNTMMPPGGAGARAHQVGTLERLAHDRLTDPELGRLLDALGPWVASLDPDAREARTVAALARDHGKAVRVPGVLAAEMAHAAALGEHAWAEARAANDFGRFRDPLERQVELRHRYIACFDDHAHPYDVLLDDFEPGLTLERLRPLFDELRDGLVPLVAQAGTPAAPGPLSGGTYPVAGQRAFLTGVLEDVGYDPDRWRLDPTLHPFAQGIGAGDTRLTTAYEESDLTGALYAGLHEFGHGLYEASIAPELSRTPLGETVSLGIHESQSRLWENFVGRSRPFCAWVVPKLRAAFPDQFAGLEPGALFRGLVGVHPSLVRVHADETTYNLHVILRTELETRLFSGELEVAALPEAWDEAIHRLLGLEVPDAVHGVLQDIHWGAGLMGYFPTYALGNLAAAQLWERLTADLPELDEQIARGDFAPLRAWLREHVHRHGRTYQPAELLRRVTGEELRVEPLLRYLREKLADAGFV